MNKSELKAALRAEALIVATVLLAAFWPALLDAGVFAAFSWEYWGAEEPIETKRSEVVRNLGLLTLGLVGLGFGVWRAYTAFLQTKTGQEQTRIAEQGHFTDRFTKAVEQLGNPALPIRLGGIYALWRLAKDSPENDSVAVLDILCATVRSPPRDSAFEQAEEKGEGDTAAIRSDVQAILDLISNPETVCSGLIPVSYVVRLEGAALSRVNLSKAIFSEINLSGANLSGANLSGANLNRANLSGANLSGANLSGANLSGANLSGANLSGANLNSAILRKTILSFTTLCSANLTGVNFGGADLKGSDFNETNLSGVNFSGANLAFAKLNGASFMRVNFSGADLSGANLNGADFFGADLGGIDLSGSGLSGTDLRWADLGGARLDLANLSKANLQLANFSKASLSGANLSGANFDEARKLTQAMLDIAISDPQNAPPLNLPEDSDGNQLVWRR